MRVVSNAGPLIALGKLGQLGLMLKLYSEVLIPREVYNEVVVNGLSVGASDAQAVDFLIQQGHVRVADVALPSPLPNWGPSIDAGEVEVIVLAQQQEADWVLLEAFRKAYLSLQEFELLMQNIKAQPDLWIGEQLCDRALGQAQQEARKQP